MGIQVATAEPHWRYFLAIEQDLDRLSRFVEFDKQNFECFSIEISHLLMTAAAEADVVCKQVCVQLKANSKANKIAGYRREILAKYPQIHKFEVTIPWYGVELKPWSNWNPRRKKRTIPEWWVAYNKIKHHRHTQFQQGSLKNALNAVAGLFVMLLYLYKQKAEAGALLPRAQLLAVTNANFVVPPADYGMRINDGVYYVL